ncbi:MAG TPA: DUF5597 domain-containing protein [Bryobacteraceae bacterium]|nr:DUF5597 domain-containing protein [Bryobacteraceae bacterium]
MRFLFPLALVAFFTVEGADLPHIGAANGVQQLVVQGKPFLIRGGELGNSSAGTAAQADRIPPALARMHLNTVLMPVAWEQVEPKEGSFDFGIPDRWIDAAAPNIFTSACCGSEAGRTRSFGAETLRLDSRAFSALMAHLREKDHDQQTVLLVQIENEMGYLGPGRDRSAAANAMFNGAVPQELAAHFNPRGGNWREAFGDAADEAFMAWRYALWVEAVARAGKREYALPMYLNAQLPALMERPGEYPSGGPHPNYLAVYRAVAPAIDFYSPDIYWPEFEYWLQRYELPGNAIFVPEARLDPAPWNALYAYGAGHAFGFCPFGIDSLDAADHEPAIAQVYGAIAGLDDMLIAAQAARRTRGIVLHANSPRASQTVALGGYLFQASLSRTWPANELLEKDGGMFLIESARDEFFVVGGGLTVKITRDPDTDAHIAGIASIEEVSRSGRAWTVTARLNGDQSNQGRQLSMAPHDIRTYRVRLYKAAE